MVYSLKNVKKLNSLKMGLLTIRLTLEILYYMELMILFGLHMLYNFDKRLLHMTLWAKSVFIIHINMKRNLGSIGF